MHTYIHTYIHTYYTYIRGRSNKVDDGATNSGARAQGLVSCSLDGTIQLIDVQKRCVKRVIARTARGL